MTSSHVMVHSARRCFGTRDGHRHSSDFSQLPTYQKVVSSTLYAQ